MIKIPVLGNYEEVPQIVSDIMEGNLAALEVALADGWNIKNEITLSKYVTAAPLELALIVGIFDSIKWLTEKKAKLNVKGNPAFLLAVRHCGEEIIRYMVEHGADIHAVNHVKSDAFTQALYGKNYDNLALIHDLGHTVEIYGGYAFRLAVSNNDYKAVDFFLDHGVDINFSEPDMVYPFKPTPLCVAARYVDFKMCKYLVEKGADVTLCEENGSRPYTIALEVGKQELAEFFKNLELPEFHDLNNKILELKKYKLPQKLIKFLQGDNLRIDFGKNNNIAYIDFFSLVDTIPFKLGREKVLRISREVDNYSDLNIVWRPKSKMIAYFDMEHKEIGDIASFDEFMVTTKILMENVINGEL